MVVRDESFEGGTYTATHHSPLQGDIWLDYVEDHHGPVTISLNFYVQITDTLPSELLAMWLYSDGTSVGLHFYNENLTIALQP